MIVQCIFTPEALAMDALGPSLNVSHQSRDNTVGPIWYGEPVSRVLKALGSARPTSRCAIGVPCRALLYTDGHNLLIVDYSKDWSGIAMIRLYLGTVARDATRLPPTTGPLTAWRWQNKPVLSWPPSGGVQGWARRGAASDKSISFYYGHGCAVSFERAAGRPAFTFYCE